MDTKYRLFNTTTFITKITGVVRPRSHADELALSSIEILQLFAKLVNVSVQIDVFRFHSDAYRAVRSHRARCARLVLRRGISEMDVPERATRVAGGKPFGDSSHSVSLRLRHERLGVLRFARLRSVPDARYRSYSSHPRKMSSHKMVFVSLQ